MTLGTLLEFIKIEHTLFALPLAMTGMVMGARGLPGLRITLLICAAFIAARTAAMAFNRWADRRFDAQNPRTSTREIPTGRILPQRALALVSGSAAIFFTCSWALNPLCFSLSPLVMVILLGYSYTKRFTCLSHFVLGLSLGMAPVAGWIAVTGSFHPAPVILGTAVLLWVAGFDILYAFQDIEFDRRAGLFSIPASLGVAGALHLAALCHGTSFALVLWTGVMAGLSWPFYAASLITAGLLFLEHHLVKSKDLNRLNTAFFRINSLVSLSILAAISLGII